MQWVLSLQVRLREDEMLKSTLSMLHTRGLLEMALTICFERSTSTNVPLTSTYHFWAASNNLLVRRQTNVQMMYEHGVHCAFCHGLLLLHAEVLLCCSSEWTTKNKRSTYHFCHKAHTIATRLFSLACSITSHVRSWINSIVSAEKSLGMFFILCNEIL